MNRAELDRLDRDTLIARAEAAGVARARILTRPELVDELLLRSSADPVAKRQSRGANHCANARSLGPLDNV